MKPSTTLSFQLHGLVYSIDKLAAELLKAESDINFPQFLIVLCAYQHPGCSKKYMADWLQLTEATVSSTSSKVFAKGYIKISADSKDARAKKIVVTRKGRQLVDRIYPIFEAALEPHFKAVSAADQKKLQHSIITIKASIDNLNQREC